MFQNLDSGELSVLIDLNQGARIASLQWRELEFSVPFRGGLFNWGWYSMAPWAGRIRNGLIKDSSGKVLQLPTVFDPPNALHGFGVFESWEDLGGGRSRLRLPEPYSGAVVEQNIEVLDNALRWSLEYDAGSCELPAWIGMHPWFPRDLDRGGRAEIEFQAKKMFAKDDYGLPITDVKKIISLHEQILSLFKKSNVVGIAMNTVNMNAQQISEAKKKLENETGLVVGNVLGDEVRLLADEVLKYFSI